jgi:photosystem II stability/assembly factor-like uncharacterized protein
MSSRMMISIAALCVMIFFAGCGGSRATKGWNFVGKSSIVLEDRSAGEPGIGVAGFIDEDTGIAVGSHVLIMKTVNGGRSWGKTVYPLGFTDLDGLEILDRKHAWTSGGFGIRVTEDGGETWTEIPHYGGVECPGHYISFADPKTGWYATGRAQYGNVALTETLDGGLNWSPVNLPYGVENLIMAIDLRNSDTGFLLLRTGVVVKTIDGGKSWTTLTLPLNGRKLVSINPGSPVGAVRFADEQTGTVVLSFEKPRGIVIFETRDSGKSWEETQLPEKARVMCGNIFLSRDRQYLTVYDIKSGGIFVYKRD